MGVSRIRIRIHQTEKPSVLRESIVERHHHFICNQQTSANLGIFNIPLFFIGDMQQPGNVVRIVLSLIQQLDVPG